MSRIPVSINRHDRTSSAPSKLEELQEQFQQKMLDAKRTNPGPVGTYMKSRQEHHSANSLASLKRSGGSVRNFFRERRTLGGVDNSSALPDIHQHYKVIQTKKNGFMEPEPGLARTPSGPKSKPPLPQYRKPGSGVGIDKSKPLAPIRKSPAMLTKQDSYEERVNSLNSRHKKASQLPSPFQKPQLARTRQWAEKHAQNNFQNYSSDENSVENSPMPARKNNSRGGGEKLTDFQKWQMEQDKARAARLAKQNQGMQKPPPIPSIKRNAQKPARRRSPTPEPSDDEDSGHDSASSHVELAEEMATKERQLMGLIKQQQEELQRMQEQRQREEEQSPQGSAAIYAEERKELDKQKQRQEEQRARQKSLEDAERKREEDRRAAEERRAEEQRRKDSEKRQKEDKKREEQRRKEDEKREKEEKKREEQRRKEKEKKEREERKREEERRKKEEREAKRGNKSTYRKEDDTQKWEAPPRDENRSPDPFLAMYEKAAEQGQEGISNLTPCPTCGRKFAADRLAKHETICTKTSQKKRKVFDPVKARVEGTEHAKYALSTAKKPKTPPKKKGNWKAKHESFINSIRYAKKVSDIEAAGGDIRTVTPPPVAEDPDLVPCPHCNRKFNSSAAERHIPRCQNLKTKPAPPRARRK